MSIPPQPPQRPPRRFVDGETQQESLTRQIFVGQERNSFTTGQTPQTAGATTENSSLQPDSGPVQPEEQATEMLSIEELSQLAKESRGNQPYNFATQANSGAGNSGHTASGPHFGSSQVFPPNREQAMYAAWQSQGYAPPGGGMPPSGPDYHFADYNSQHSPGKKKRSVPGWAIVLVIVAIIAVVATIAFIVFDSMRGPTQRTATPPPPVAEGSSTGPSSNLDETPAQTTAPANSDVESFQTPSGNIVCAIDAERVRCLIAEFSYDPGAAPQDCQVNPYGSVVVAGADGAGYSCAQGEPLVSTNTLDYGQEISAHNVTCTSAEDGVTCAHADGPGFKIARAGVQFS